MLPLLASSNISNIATNKRGSKSSNLAIIIGTWRKEGDHNKENNSSIHTYSAKRAKEMEVSTDDIPSLRGWFLKVR